MTNQDIAARYNVIPEQLDRVSYFIDEQTHTPLFKVQSATTSDLIYTIKWNIQCNRPQCECRAAQDGRICWHVQACLAVLSLHAQAKRDQAEAATQLELREAEASAEREYLDTIKPYQWPAAQVDHDAERYAPRPFNILR